MRNNRRHSQGIARYNGQSLLQFGTTIIRLNNFDNRDSLMDKVRQVLTSEKCPPRILLIWPPRGRVLNDAVDLALVKKLISDYGCQLAIASESEGIRAMAEELEIPVFEDADTAPSSGWAMRRGLPRPEERSIRELRLANLRDQASSVQQHIPERKWEIFFFFAALASCLLAAFAVFPSAEVSVSPIYTHETADITMWTNDTLKSATLTGGVPSSEETYTLTLSATVPTTGSVETAGNLAVGTIRVRNACDARKGSEAGVELYTDQGIVFRTLDDLLLDPGAETILRIEAVEPGSSGNLEAGSIRTAEYPQSICWDVFQEEPTHDGMDGIRPAPSEADYETAAGLIREQVQNEAPALLSGNTDILPVGDAVITKIIEETMTPEYGYAADEVTLTQTLSVSVPVVKIADSDQIIREMLRGEDNEVVVITTQLLSAPSKEGDRVTWKVSADRQSYSAATNEEAVRAMLRGKSLDTAKEILRTIQPGQEGEIKIHPAWFGFLPFWADRINVNISSQPTEQRGD